MTMNETIDSQPLPAYQVGQRIEIDRSRGTIRFLGLVPPTTGEWIGVEWDDKERGKHSGEHQGTQYFTCQFPGTGSFTRPSKKIETGTSLVEILKERYIDLDKGNGAPIYLGNNVEVEVVGFELIKERQRNLHLMTAVGLANTNVATAAGYEETQETCPNIEDLDLSSTLVSTWQTIADISLPLKKLKILRLSRNRFMPLTLQPDFSESFRGLRCLSMNRVFLKWEQIELLEPSMPNLEILQFGFNQLTNLGSVENAMEEDSGVLPKVKGFENLQMMHLEGNLFEDWSQIQRLSKLPKLTLLDVSENKFRQVGPPELSGFEKLDTIRINDNLLDNWSDVVQLGLYGSLRAVWIGNNPVMRLSEGQSGDTNVIDARTATIARMSQIDSLNGSDIAKKERIDAELYYLKHVVLSTEGMEALAVNQLHPRFEQLCQIHGRPDISAESRKATSEILKDRLIAITLVHKTRPSGPPKNSIQKNVLGTMTIKNLKNLVQRTLKVPVRRQELYFLVNDPDYADKMVTVRMEDDLRQISFYEVMDNQEVTVLDKGT